MQLGSPELGSTDGDLQCVVCGQPAAGNLLCSPACRQAAIAELEQNRLILLSPDCHAVRLSLAARNGFLTSVLSRCSFDAPG